jgi:hypothetical protein
LSTWEPGHVAQLGHLPGSDRTSSRQLPPTSGGRPYHRLIRGDNQGTIPEGRKEVRGRRALNKIAKVRGRGRTVPPKAGNQPVTGVLQFATGPSTPSREKQTVGGRPAGYAEDMNRVIEHQRSRTGADRSIPAEQRREMQCNCSNGNEQELLWSSLTHDDQEDISTSLVPCD